MAVRQACYTMAFQKRRHPVFLPALEAPRTTLSINDDKGHRAFAKEVDQPSGFTKVRKGLVPTKNRGQGHDLEAKAVAIKPGECTIAVEIQASGDAGPARRRRGAAFGENEGIDRQERLTSHLTVAGESARSRASASGKRRLSKTWEATSGKKLVEAKKAKCNTLAVAT